VKHIVGQYYEMCNAACVRYYASAEYKDYCAKAEAKATEQRIKREAILARSPGHMTVVDTELWEAGKAANSDPYAERWARMMEGAINSVANASGITELDPSFVELNLKTFADDYSHLADVEGITGYIYGAAVSILSKAWIHGESLRRWHNLKTQLRNEGEIANESGGVLNPAVLSIG